MAQGDLVAELGLLYRAAGRPSYRRISAEIRRHDHMPDTVSHETISSILRGGPLARWSKVECLVRQLAAMAVHRPDPGEEVKRFHALWLAASDAQQPPLPAPPPTPPPAPLPAPQPTPRPTVEPANPKPANPKPLDPKPLDSLPTDEQPAGAGGSAQPAGGSAPTGAAPARNPGFTGREELLELVRTRLAGDPWQPLILYGLGGVGKTQLAIEYFHRHADRYDFVWWITAEDPSQATVSLAALGERQDWPTSLDMAQTVRTVLSKLEAGVRPETDVSSWRLSRKPGAEEPDQHRGRRAGKASWLMVFDNAGAPDDLRTLIPAAGGDVIVTTRDAAWLGLGRSVEVDVFARRESIELLRARGHDITFDEADQLAYRLGDLPLALEQVAAMQSATRTRVKEYLRQLDERALQFLDSTPPGDYPTTVATAFVVAADRVRQESTAAAQLLELLSCLGAEPISLTLLRSASGRIPAPLGRLLDQPGPLGDAIWLLRRYGLIKVVDDGQTLQVHRLVQAIVRDALPEDARARARRSARHLLAAVNPGNPDRPLTWDMHLQIGPHLRPAQVIESTDPEVRQVVIDQAVYLFEIGDFDGSRRLSDDAWNAWTRAGTVDDEQVHACLRRLVASLNAMGRHDESHRLTHRAWTRLMDHPGYGPDHPTTLEFADVMAVLQRVFGDYADALRTDRDRVDRCRRILGDDHAETVRARSNLAASLRAVGDYRAAYDIDADLVDVRRNWLGPDHQWTLLSISNLARDLYGLGDYAAALELQRSVWPAYRGRLGDRHPQVLAAWRTIVLGLRKTGQIAPALEEGVKLHLICQGHLGTDHAQTLAATMTHANTLRAAGEVFKAWNTATEALERYRRRYGDGNPLTLAAATNHAIILRATGERRRARYLAETSYQALGQILGPDHPYTIAAAIGVANDLVLAHEDEMARSLLTRTLEVARRVRGQRHPETLTCAVNLGLLLRRNDPDAGALLDSSLGELRRILGTEHPLVTAAGEGRHGECDIEPPPV